MSRGSSSASWSPRGVRFAGVKAEFLGEFEGPCEALATIGELIAWFGDEQNPNIRSTVVEAYELRERIIQECFRRTEVADWGRRCGEA